VTDFYRRKERTRSFDLFKSARKEHASPESAFSDTIAANPSLVGVEIDTTFSEKQQYGGRHALICLQRHHRRKSNPRRCRN
jgi:hypothetical protein